jgi:hypothetical protein
MNPRGFLMGEQMVRYLLVTRYCAWRLMDEGKPLSLMEGEEQASRRIAAIN